MKLFALLMLFSVSVQAEIKNIKLDELRELPFLAVTGFESSGPEVIRRIQKSRANKICVYLGYIASTKSSVDWINNDVEAFTIKRHQIVHTLGKALWARYEFKGPLEVASSVGVYKFLQCAR